MKRLAPALILLLAFALRVLGLTSVPPGWRDDEVIETTVHAQMVLDGHYPLYFIQAEGHEPLYHYVSAGWIALVGNSLFAVRMVSVVFGLLTVAASYRLTRQLFGIRTALLVTLLVAVSFWALMYSRTKIRHIAELPFLLLAFSSLFSVLGYRYSKLPQNPATSPLIRQCALLVLFAVLALYTYLASTTLFIILLLFITYLLITNYFLLFIHLPKKILLAIGACIVIIALLYLPLANAISANAQRIAVVGGPLTALREGNWQPLLDNTVGTLAMFGHTGDNEALYNIPGRPVFNVVGFFFFLGGIIIALSRWRDPRYALLLIWLLGGLAPGFASNPAASLGHTLTVMPVTYILAVLPVMLFTSQGITGARRLMVSLLGVGLVASVAISDLTDYFIRWPALPEVRYLYKAELHQWAKTFQSHPAETAVFSGPLSKWDRVAVELEDLAFASPPRWVNAEWANIFTPQDAVYTFEVSGWQTDAPAQHPAAVHFNNDITFSGWIQNGREVLTQWQVGPAYAITEMDMGSSVDTPPSPIFIFLHLLDGTGAQVGGSDRFDVDAFSLQPDDRFVQRHAFAPELPAGPYSIEIGLYNPISGERYITDDGRDTVSLGEIELTP